MRGEQTPQAVGSTDKMSEDDDQLFVRNVLKIAPEAWNLEWSDFKCSVSLEGAELGVTSSRTSQRSCRTGPGTVMGRCTWRSLQCGSGAERGGGLFGRGKGTLRRVDGLPTNTLSARQAHLYFEHVQI